MSCTMTVVQPRYIFFYLVDQFSTKTYFLFIPIYSLLNISTIFSQVTYLRLILYLLKPQSILISVKLTEEINTIKFHMLGEK